jgi:serine/threonine protein kinase
MLLLADEKLGAGDIGEVYKARGIRFDHPVAIKVLAGYIAGREDLRRRFECEARGVASLNHSYICVLRKFATLWNVEGPIRQPPRKWTGAF